MPLNRSFAIAWGKSELTEREAMQYERLYADASGATHFEPVSLKLDEADYRPPAPMLFVSHALSAGSLQFIRLPVGWAGENICPPQHLPARTSRSAHQRR